MGEQREKVRVPEVKKRDGHTHHCSTLPYRVGYSIGFHIGCIISRKYKHEQVGLDFVLEHFLLSFCFFLLPALFLSHTNRFFISLVCLITLCSPHSSSFLLFSSFTPVTGFVLSLYLFPSKPAVELRWLSPLIQIFKIILNLY